jgi:hypothetical protein
MRRALAASAELSAGRKRTRMVEHSRWRRVVRPKGIEEDMCMGPMFQSQPKLHLLVFHTLT